MAQKKDVRVGRAARVKTKNRSLPTKKVEPLPGHVECRLVRCGKLRCRCTRGELHGPYYYHLRWTGGGRVARYVKRADLERTLAACEAYRRQRRESRRAAAIFRLLMAEIRGMSL